MSAILADSPEGLVRTTGIIQPNADYTRVGWRYINGPLPSIFPTIWYLGNDPALFTEGIWIGCEPDRILNVFENATATSHFSTIRLRLGWHHFAYVRSGTTHLVYVDGVLYVSFVADLSAETWTHVLAGTDTIPGDWIAALLAYDGEFDVAFTPEQVQAQRLSPTPIMAAWTWTPLDADLLDTSGNGHHWSESGGTITFGAQPAVPPPSIPVELLPDPQYAAPAAADGVSVALPGVSWGNSAYGEVLAAADADGILTEVVVRPPGALFTGFAFEVDVAIGPAGFEVPISTFGGILHEVFATVASEGLVIPTFIGIDAIPNGERVSMRWRCATTDTTAAFLSLTYYKKPLEGTLLTSENPVTPYPGLGLITVATGGGGWTDGSAVEIWDDTVPNDRAIVGVLNHLAQANTEWEVDLLLGADADVVATTLHATRGGVSSLPNDYSLPNPLVIPALTKLSAVSRQDNVDVVNVTIALLYVDLP